MIEKNAVEGLEGFFQFLGLLILLQEAFYFIGAKIYARKS